MPSPEILIIGVLVLLLVAWLLVRQRPKEAEKPAESPKPAAEKVVVAQKEPEKPKEPERPTPIVAKEPEKEPEPEKPPVTKTEPVPVPAPEPPPAPVVAKEPEKEKQKEKEPGFAPDDAEVLSMREMESVRDVETAKPPPAKPVPPKAPPAKPPVPASKVATSPSVAKPASMPVQKAAEPAKASVPVQKAASVPVQKAADPVSPAATSATTKAAAVAAKYLAPSNPETAELEKNDPRHAAARRLARLTVSEIKLYHEADVTAGRAAKDLWKRLQKDIGLALQTYDQRTDKEVRERFDYLYDEILRQLAEGDAAKLGPEAPKKSATAAPVAKAAEPAPAPASPPKDTAATQPVATPPPPPPPPVEEPAPVVAKVSETADLEKSDPKHAAARRFARVAVSEIKLYHEAEVKQGRESKDLWKRMGKEINLAISTYEQRIDKEVRDRFDYLYDELVKQLAEGDPGKLGADAPHGTGKGGAAPASAPVIAKSEPKVPVATPAPKPEPVIAKSEPKVPVATPAPKAEPVVAKSEPKIPVAAKPAEAPATDGRAAAAAIAAKYMQPSNPETADLEKNDPRHAAARRFARLSVSEIKLYHEAEVKQGRESKDLWTRLQKDIGLARQTYEQRVDKEVRERFDYLYDEILRQLAEGDADKLGPHAPQKKG